MQCEGKCSELVQAVRQHSSWQGQAEPRRIMVVVNPVSGQGKCAALCWALPLMSLIHDRLPATAWTAAQSLGLAAESCPWKQSSSV